MIQRILGMRNNEILINTLILTGKLEISERFDIKYAYRKSVSTVINYNKDLKNYYMLLDRNKFSSCCIFEILSRIVVEYNIDYESLKDLIRRFNIIYRCLKKGNIAQIDMLDEQLKLADDGLIRDEINRIKINDSYNKLILIRKDGAKIFDIVRDNKGNSLVNSDEIFSNVRCIAFDSLRDYKIIAKNEKLKANDKNKFRMYV